MGKVKPSSTAPPTISAMQKDRITEIAKTYWAPFSDNHEPYSAEIIEDLYKNELFEAGFVKKKIVLLEFSQYLEAYLWPNFGESATDAHVMSIVVMLNEKFRERVPAWTAFINAPANFSLFFNRVLKLALREEGISFIEQNAILTFLVNFVNSVEVDLVRKEIVKLSSLNILANLFPSQRLAILSKSQNFIEQNAILTFLVNCVNSVEVDLVRKEIVKLSSLNILANLFPSQRLAILSKSQKLFKYWNKLETKFSQLPAEEQEPIIFNRTVLWKLLQKFLKVLAFVDDPNTEFEPEAVKYLERFLEFSIDMISLLTTRRFFNQLIIFSHLLVRAAQSDLIKTEVGALFCKLITRLKFYVRFEIDDVNGVALTENEMIQRHYDHVVELQKAAFKFFKERMSTFYLLSASSIDTPKALIQQLSELNEDDLYSFAEYLHLVPTREEKQEYNWPENY
uniref:Intron-binding protein aquarius N-terminal domain-containing protein n=1 Tax=Panagrolaimus sp. JU765 TaxID=591449 RepID=A0AC34QAF5_9BILA